MCVYACLPRAGQLVNARKREERLHEIRQKVEHIIEKGHISIIEELPFILVLLLPPKAGQIFYFFLPSTFFSLSSSFSSGLFYSRHLFPLP